MLSENGNMATLVKQPRRKEDTLVLQFWGQGFVETNQLVDGSFA
jgi:hypothetical protein